MEIKNVVLYCSVSTAEQEKGSSLDWQEDYLRRYCEMKRYNVISVYKEDKSAKTGFSKRTEFQALMKYCKAHKHEVDYVLVYRWDRYSRNLKEALINLDFFEKMISMLPTILRCCRCIYQWRRVKIQRFRAAHERVFTHRWKRVNVRAEPHVDISIVR